ncbi:hypothetical protein ACNSPD_07775 [Yersinia enterocolitica]|uniref:hypothetical protein n=1 Tax=Yersinia TaxID=629 RepID=UPI003AB11CA8
MDRVNYHQAFFLDGKPTKDYDGISYSLKTKLRDKGFDLEQDGAFAFMPNDAPPQVPRLNMQGNDGNIKVVISLVRADLYIDYSEMSKEFTMEEAVEISLIFKEALENVGVNIEYAGMVITYAKFRKNPVGDIKTGLLNANNTVFDKELSSIAVKTRSFFPFMDNNEGLNIILNIESAVEKKSRKSVLMIKKDINNLKIKKLTSEADFQRFMEICVQENNDDVINSVLNFGG